RVEVDAAVGLAAVQEERDREDGQLGDDEEEGEQAPEAGLDQASGEEIEERSGHSDGGSGGRAMMGGHPVDCQSRATPPTGGRQADAHLARGLHGPHAGCMPELPEVETTRRGLAPHLEGARVAGVLLRRPDLRWPIPPEVGERLPGQRIDAVRRRAKYLLVDTAAGSALLHLGMSGSLRVLPADTPPGAHDHVDIALEARGAGPRVLRFNDPRRFGCLLWQAPGTVHPLLAGLGPEPLGD